MSRIGKLPIKIPNDVIVDYNTSEITVKGKFGILQKDYPKTLIIERNSGNLYIKFKIMNRSTKSLQGLYRTLINNMVIGVSEQFEITLVLKGVGYRALVKGKELTLSLGYSHPVKVEIPAGISVEVIQNTTINLKSCDKEKLGLFASNIRAWRKPEPYKGKGILYKDEQIIRKAGKSGK